MTTYNLDTHKFETLQLHVGQEEARSCHRFPRCPKFIRQLLMYSIIPSMQQIVLALLILETSTDA